MKTCEENQVSKKKNVNENKRIKLIKIKDLINVDKKGSIKKEGAVM